MQTLFAASAATSTQSLVDKYRPNSIAEFVGLASAKKVCSKLSASPRECGLLFHGEPGMGKTTMALALAENMPAELHHIPSQSCNLETLKKVIDTCHYIPKLGKKMHLVLIDEADQMSSAAQLYLLSKLDSTGRVPNTIFVFTCNSMDGLEARFQERCIPVEFSSYGNSEDAAILLSLVWECEANGADAPNFARIIKESKGSIRKALQRIDKELLLA